MKRLALFCDATWNGADQARDGVPCPTNVVKLAFRVAKRDAGVPQVVHYGQGVGTGNSLDRLTGGAFGDGLVDNVHAACRFLIANYEPGDELYFFGFSRGAFTARSLVGVIRKCGILDRGAVGRYAEATSLYRSDDGPDAADPLEFRRSCAIGGIGPVAVKFIGVCDTVGALGIPLRGLRGLTRGDYAFQRRRAQRHRRARLPGAGDRRTPTSTIRAPACTGSAAGIDRVIGLAAQPTRQPDGRSTETDPTQDLHPSVRERWDARPDYRPKNLRDYFHRIGDPRGAHQPRCAPQRSCGRR